MAVANSKTDVVNLALDIIKTENINNVEIPGNNKAAVIANRWYDNVRTSILEGFPWSFASTRAAIPLSATDPDFGFDDAYELPSNYLSLGFIKYWDYPLSRWNYMVENGCLYMDNGGAESLNIGYAFDQQIVAKFSPSFVLYFAYALAEQVVYKLTGNVNLQTRVTNGRKTEELKAKANNGKSNPPVAFRSSRMLQGRRVYGGSSVSGLYTEQNGRT